MNSKTMKKWSKRIVLWTIFILVIIILQNSIGSFSSQAPSITAEWEIDSMANNHIGGLIQATLRISAQSGVTVDTSQLPDTGDVLPLPTRIGSTSMYDYNDQLSEIVEGELEVVSRRVVRYSADGLVVTEIDYEFQYLVPIDLSEPLDGKQLPWNLPVFQSYQRFFVSTGKVEWLTTKVHVKTADFHIAPRVDKESKPIFKLFELAPSTAIWLYIRLAGFGCLALAFGLLVWWGVSLIRIRRPQDQIVPQSLSASEMYQDWCKNPDHSIFVETLKLYRLGAWGRPQIKMWIETTFILYSGISLTKEQTENVFARLIKEVTDEHPS